MINRKAGKRKRGRLREIMLEILDLDIIVFLIRVILWIPRLIVSFFRNVF
jgi:hypothetical protein